MFGGPGYHKPTHQYGQSFGEEAEVLDAEWAGAGFTLPYKEEEGGTDEPPEHGPREAG